LFSYVATAKLRIEAPPRYEAVRSAGAPPMGVGSSASS
jgi:hypothetical protein